MAARKKRLLSNKFQLDYLDESLPSEELHDRQSDIVAPAFKPNFTDVYGGPPVKKRSKSKKAVLSKKSKSVGSPLSVDSGYDSKNNSPSLVENSPEAQVKVVKVEERKENAETDVRRSTRIRSKGAQNEPQVERSNNQENNVNLPNLVEEVASKSIVDTPLKIAKSSDITKAPDLPKSLKQPDMASVTNDDDLIKVVVRVRKLINREKNEKKAFSVQDSQEVVQKGTDKTWRFDRVYSQADDNQAVYAGTAQNIIESAVVGYNSTIFAYGQTSSGKTHTMMGTEDEPGIIRLAVDHLFYAIEETPDRTFLMQVSYMEIYNETILDLLCEPSKRKESNLKIRESETGNVYVEGLEATVVSDPEEVINLMRLGEKNRHYGETNMNARSSRSHTIFRIILESKARTDSEDDGTAIMVSHLNLVDLAGSEKAGQTGAGGARLKEGCNINKSLMMLGQVIQKLSSGAGGHVNFRDSKLTRILQNSLGGNARTAIIATVTPAAMSVEQTISTLRFAHTAKNIQQHAEVNEVLDDQARMNRMKTEIEELQKQLDEQRMVNGSELVQEMQEKLEQEKREKESHINKIRELQLKVLVSSQPAPAAKPQIKRNVRRETWCGPNMRKSMRQSFAFHKLLRPLPSPLLSMVNEEEPNASVMVNESVSSVDFNNTPNKLEAMLLDNENSMLEKMEEWDEDVNNSVFEAEVKKEVPDKKKKRKTVMFMSPEPSVMDRSVTDSETPKAVIRDKYRRVSQRLSTAELQLLKTAEEKEQIERELDELQEFTRLESETGVDEDRRASRSSADFGNEELQKKYKFLEKSFKDAEALNLETNKELRQTKLEHDSLKLKFEELTEKFNATSSMESSASESLKNLQEQHAKVTEQLKIASVKAEELEKGKMDYDMMFEMAMHKKTTLENDLRKHLEVVYEDMAALESGDKQAVKARYAKMEELQAQLREVNELLAESRAEVDKLSASKDDEGLMTSLKEEIEQLKEGLEIVTTELEAQKTEKERLEGEVGRLQTLIRTSEDSKSDDQGGSAEALEQFKKQVAKYQSEVEDSGRKLENMELSNQSLLETVDKLHRDNDELQLQNGSLVKDMDRLEARLVELERCNRELSEEGAQLRAEVTSTVEERDQVRMERDQLREEMAVFEEEKEKMFGVIENSGEENKVLMEEFEATVKEKEELQKEVCELKRKSKEFTTGGQMEEKVKSLDVERDALLLKLGNVECVSEDNQASEKLRMEKDAIEIEKNNLIELLNEREAELLKANDFVKKMSMEMEQVLDTEAGKPSETIHKEYEELKNVNKALMESKTKIEEDKNKLEAEVQELKKLGCTENVEEMEAKEEKLILLKLEVEDLQEKLLEADKELKEKRSTMEDLTEENAKLLQEVQGNKEQAQLSIMSKLSATLSTIDESFYSARDEMESTLKSPGEALNLTANPMNQTMVPIEVVDAIKNQLLALQDQLIAFDPDQLKNSQIKVQQLEKELKASEQKANEERVSLEKELKNKHKTEIAIITNKMREEINFNMPALEEKIREEVTTKKNEEMKELRIQYEGQLESLKLQLNSVTENYEMAKSMAAIGPSKTPDQSINVAKRLSHNFSMANMTSNENMEMSFDETMGSMSMSMIQGQMMIPGKGMAGEQDSIQVQMLKGELEQVRAALEAKETELEEIKSLRNDSSKNIVTDVDVNASNENDEELKRIVAKQNNELESLKAENVTNDAQLNQVEQDLQNETISKGNLQTVVDTLKDSEELLRTSLANQEIQMEQLKVENESLKYSCEALNADKEVLQAQVVKASETIEALKIEKSSFQETAADVDTQVDNVQNLEAKITVLESQISERDAGIQELEIRLEDTASEIKKLQETNAKSLVEHDELISSKNKEIANMKEKLDEFEIKCQSFEEAIAKNNELSDLKETMEITESELRTKITNLNETVERHINEVQAEKDANILLESQLNQLQDHLNEKSSELESVVKMKESMMGSESDLQKLLEEKEVEVNKLKNDKKHDQELFEQCLKTAQTERDNAKELIKEYEGQLDQISITEQKLTELNEQYSKLEELNKNLKDNLDDVCGKIKSEKENNQLLKEEMEKIEMEQGAVNEQLKNDVEEKDNQIEMGVRRLKELEEKLDPFENLKQAYEDLKETEATLLKQVATSEGNLASHADLIETLKSDLIQVQHELATLKEEKSLITSEAESLISEARLKEESMEKENLELVEKLQHIEEQLREKNDALQELEDVQMKTVTTLKEQLLIKEEELEQKTKMVAMENDEKNKLLQVKIDELETASNNVKADLANLESEKLDLSSQLEKTKDLLTKTEETKLEVGAENEKLKLSLKGKEETENQNQEMLYQLEEKLKLNEDLIEEMKKQIENSQLKDREGTEKLDMAASEIKSLKSDLNDALASGEQIKIDLSADFQIKENELMSQIQKLLSDIENCQEEINKTKEIFSQYEEEKCLLQETITNLECVMTNGKVEYDNVCTEKADLSQQIEAIKDEMAKMRDELENENSQLKGQVVDLDSEWNSKMDNVLKDLDSAKLEVQEISKQKEVIKEEYVKLESEMNVAVNDKTKEIEHQKNKIDELESTESFLKHEMSKKDLELNEKEAQFNSKTEIMKERLSKMELEIKSKDEEFGMKNDEQRAMLKAKLDSLEEEYMASKIELQNVLAEKASVVSQLELVVDKQQTESLELNKKIEESKEIEVHKNKTIDQLKEDLRKALFEVSEVEKQRDVVDEECNKLEKQLKEKVADSCELERLKAKIVELEESEKRWKFEAEEIEKQRDIVDGECDRLEAELETTKNRLEAELEETKTKLQDLSRATTPDLGQRTLLGDVSMECTFAGNLPKLDQNIQKITSERDQLKSELSQLKAQLKSLDESKTKMAGEQAAINEKFQKLKAQFFTQKEYGDRMYRTNKELQQQISALDSAEIQRKQEEMSNELAKVKEELGQKNIAYASLKVDVEKEELKYKKKCTVLEGDLEYEKKNSTRLTQELRRLQSEKMDTTVLGHGRSAPTKEVQEVKAPEPAVQSPVWSNGAGVIKEIILQELEVKNKRLEKEKKELKQHEEFYINKAREWKTWALKYEKVLKTNNIQYEPREKPVQKTQAEADSNEHSAVASSDAENVPPPLQDVSNVSNVAEGNASRNATGQRPPTPTQNMKLVLSRASGPTAYRKEGSTTSEGGNQEKPDDCKTQ